MVFVSMYDILIEIIGSPVDDVQKEILYLSASCISVIFVFFVPYIFKVIAGLISPKNL